MIRFSAPSYVRLRRLPEDPRLYITHGGSTDAGYLAESELHYSSGDVPILHFELEEHPYDLIGEGIDSAQYDITVDRLLAHDADELAKAVRSHEFQHHRLVETLARVRNVLSDAEPPECGHEDVIETPELGEATVRGVCMWCPAPLLRLNNEWVPA